MINLMQQGLDLDYVKSSDLGGLFEIISVRVSGKI